MRQKYGSLVRGATFTAGDSHRPSEAVSGKGVVSLNPGQNTEVRWPRSPELT